MQRCFEAEAEWCLDACPRSLRGSVRCLYEPKWPLPQLNVYCLPFNVCYRLLPFANNSNNSNNANNINNSKNTNNTSNTRVKRNARFNL